MIGLYERASEHVSELKFVASNLSAHSSSSAGQKSVISWEERRVGG